MDAVAKPILLTEGLAESENGCGGVGLHGQRAQVDPDVYGPEKSLAAVEVPCLVETPERHGPSGRDKY